MNSVDRINVSVPQITFSAKGRKATNKIVDKVNETAIRFLNKDKSLAERTESLMRESVSATLKNIIGHIKSNKRSFEQYKRYITAEVEAGRLDADHAIALLAKKRSLNLNI